VCCHVMSDECSLMSKSDTWNCRKVIKVIFKRDIFGIIFLNYLWFNLCSYLTCLKMICQPFGPRGLI